MKTSLKRPHPSHASYFLSLWLHAALCEEVTFPVMLLCICLSAKSRGQAREEKMRESLSSYRFPTMPCTCHSQKTSIFFSSTSLNKVFILLYSHNFKQAFLLLFRRKCLSCLPFKTVQLSKLHKLSSFCHYACSQIFKKFTRCSKNTDSANVSQHYLSLSKCTTSDRTITYCTPE